jgi:type IV secretion system protein TrbL
MNARRVLAPAAVIPASVLATATEANATAGPPHLVRSPSGVCSLAPTLVQGVCHLVGGSVHGAWTHGPAGVVSGAATSVVGGVVDTVLSGLAHALSSAVVWFLSQIARLVTASTTVDVGADWFRAHYAVMVALAATLCLLFLLLSAAGALVHRDPARIGRAAPMVAVAGLGCPVAMFLTLELLRVSDALSSMVSGSMHADLQHGLTGASKVFAVASLLTADSGTPVMVTVIAALVTVAAALMLWIELLLRAAGVYAALLFMPLALAGLSWAPAGRWAKRLVETLVALIFSKFVIVAVLSLAASGMAAGHDGAADVLVGIAMLWIGALSPYLLLKLIGVFEVTLAAAAFEGFRSRGVHTGVYYGQSALALGSRATGTGAALAAAGMATGAKGGMRPGTPPIAGDGGAKP